MANAAARISLLQAPLQFLSRMKLALCIEYSDSIVVTEEGEKRDMDLDNVGAMSESQVSECIAALGLVYRTVPVPLVMTLQECANTYTLVSLSLSLDMYLALYLSIFI